MKRLKTTALHVISVGIGRMTCPNLPTDIGLRSILICGQSGESFAGTFLYHVACDVRITLKITGYDSLRL